MLIDKRIGISLTPLTYIDIITGECPIGYIVDELRCVDENECISNNGHGPCQDTCKNTEGSFMCACDVR